MPFPAPSSLASLVGMYHQYAPITIILRRIFTSGELFLCTHVDAIFDAPRLPIRAPFVVVQVLGIVHRALDKCLVVCGGGKAVETRTLSRTQSRDCQKCQKFPVCWQ